MSETVIKIENVSKQYRLGSISSGTISHDVNRWWYKIRGKEDPYLRIGDENDRTAKGSSEYVWALQNIDLEINHGDIVGIIGRNGAGKSTLLKILSRTTSPTTGSIKVKGRIASLLEVGTGFHPELSGRENIFLNGAILGMTKNEIKRKFNEIVDFAGVERYIDTPVKRYSSGMYVRLAFGVAAHLEPEILVVDEVLAVGDAEFQKKCIGKMKDVSEREGRTVLFVSHNMSAVSSLCNTGILLSNGKVQTTGTMSNVIHTYQKSDSYAQHWIGLEGDSSLKFYETEILSSDNERFLNSSKLKVKMTFETFENFNDLVIGFTIKSQLGSSVASTLYNDFNDLNFISKGKYQVIFEIPSFSLATGDYEIIFNISINHVKKFNSNKNNLSFKISAENEIGNKFYLQNNHEFNSVVRQNWFKEINQIS